MWFSPSFESTFSALIDWLIDWVISLDSTIRTSRSCCCYQMLILYSGEFLIKRLFLNDRFRELNFEDLLDYLYTIRRFHFEPAVKFMRTAKFIIFENSCYKMVWSVHLNGNLSLVNHNIYYIISWTFYFADSLQQISKVVQIKGFIHISVSANNCCHILGPLLHSEFFL